MLKTGEAYLAGLRDGRTVYVGGRRVDDVTTDPSSARAAQTIAMLYDLKRRAEFRDALSFEADGDRHGMNYLVARTRDDLQRRSDAHRIIAEATHGLLGRSPDYVSSFITGMSTMPEMFGEYAPNVTDYYRYMRDNDIYAAHAIVAPAGSRDPAFYQRSTAENPACRVVREDDDGVVISGMKLLATGAAIADEILIGNIIPLAPENKNEAITFMVPCNAKGLSLWSRKPLEPHAVTEFDNPLAWRFDETDAVCVFDEVKVPWERVFVHNDVDLSRALYIKTPAHSYGNHQSNVRFLAKLQLIVGLAARVAQSSGADAVPAVRETLGRLAAFEATLGAIIAGQIYACETWKPEIVSYNRRFMYAGMNWCAENYSLIVDTLRELVGGSVFQMPADATVMTNPETRELFEKYWPSPKMTAEQRMKLHKLAWELIGSEFAGRQTQYEKFFPGPSFIVRGHSYREADWTRFQAIVDDLMASYDLPEAPLEQPYALTEVASP